MLIQKAKQFIKNIIPTDRVAIFHHNDADGVCSAVIIAKALPHFELRLVPEHGRVRFTDKIIKELKENKINKIISVDLAIHEDPQTVKQVEKFAEILALDHHKVYSEISSNRTTLILPSMLKKVDDAKYPVSKLAYDLVPNPKTDWLAATGIIGDMCYKSHKAFIDKTLKKYKLKQNKDIYKTKLGNLSNLIEYAIIASVSFDIIFEDLYTLDYNYAISRLKKYAAPIEKEINQALKDFKTKAEFHKDLAFYEPTTTYHLGSLLSNLISKEHPHTSIIVISPIFSGGLKVNARRQDFKVPMNDLLKKAIKNIKGASGGGHIPAAGAYLPTKSKKEFKKQLLKALKSFK